MTKSCVYCKAMFTPCDSEETKCEFCSDYDSQAEALNAQELAWNLKFNMKFNPYIGRCKCPNCGDE